MNIAIDRSKGSKRLLFAIILLALLLMVALFAAPRSAAAQGQTLGVCTASVTLNLSPGLLLLQQTSGSNQSFG